MEENKNKKVVKSRQEIHWYFLHDYIKFLRHKPVYFMDTKLASLIQDLEDYIGDKLETPFEGEILDFYAVEEKELFE